MLDPIDKFRGMKWRGEKITALTAYDYPTARLLDESGIDIILVGDSVGMVVLGYQDTTRVTLEEMLHHTRAAARGVKQAFLVADMPIHSYDTPSQAVETARQFVDVGAQAVKLEGGVSHIQQIEAITRAEFRSWRTSACYPNMCVRRAAIRSKAAFNPKRKR
jgi:Ketopantoate hydroxymethyltransferase